MKFEIKKPKKVLVACDMSQAEVRAAVNTSQEDNMIKAYREGKDLYAMIGAAAFKTTYDDCLEFYPEGSKIIYEGKEVICGHKEYTNKEGKSRRSKSKKILLGLLYGRGTRSIAEQIGATLEEANEIMDNFFKAFPKLKIWMEKTKAETSKLGYVDDCFGRRRHLPKALLPKYSFELIKKQFNPFLICEDYNGVDDKTQALYVEKLNNCKTAKQRTSVITEARDKDNINIIDNSSEIAEALRESLNWKCQAQTASWIKLDMISIDNDDILKDLGAELLLTIHDEVILQVPEENAEACKERVEHIMRHRLDDLLCVPMPCDGSVEPSGHWYMSELETALNALFNNLKDKGLSDEEAFNSICEEHCELLKENIYNFLFKGDYLR